jgi:hypothetical protein
MKEQPPPDAKCRDKFLVQSVAVTADKEFTNIGSIVRIQDYSGLGLANSVQWQSIDDADRTAAQEKKIRVVYLAPESASAAATPLRNGINGANGSVSHRSCVIKPSN